jgi:hypothetical protein
VEQRKEVDGQTYDALSQFGLILVGLLVSLASLFFSVEVFKLAIEFILLVLLAPKKKSSSFCQEEYF